MKLSVNELYCIVVEQAAKISRLEAAIEEKDELLQKLVPETKPKPAAVQPEKQV